MMERFMPEELGPSPGYSYATLDRDVGLIFTAGAVPLDDEGRLVGEGDYRAQTTRALENLEVALSAAGGRSDEVLRTTIYVASDIRQHLIDVWDVVSASPFVKSACTLLGVSVLGYTGQLVEIEAIGSAARDDSRSKS